ncbi:very-long-chain (3R)-3-hydroxyacyl-CoA dehydratase isoform X2 [Cimex lectularius]|nr:very-long-chain (3R)-3-hydroxyacyl-CoA dehydratase isoform X2 [Cimex lectularius]XP_014251348.1 very-long-chain (3R)-3-hydroxyacyl-CoA dehydratase isoform X2 [Cimex lectularius]
MSAKGVGAHGATSYSFVLNFYSDIDLDEDAHQVKTSPRAVEFILKKASACWWPRLIKHQQKPPWLKIDFEKWRSEDEDFSDANNSNSNVANTKDIMGDYPELYEKLKKEEFGYVKEDIKKVYLVFYNLTQFVFFMYILIVMGVRFAKEGADSLEDTYEVVGAVLKFAQLIQYLEVMHPLFGYVKGSTTKALMQVTGRCIVLFAMIEPEQRMWRKPVVSWLIIIWSTIEIIRYPYYIAELYNKSFGLLTWLRYTMWIPLYPLGALCEGIIIIRNIPYFEETERFVVSLPNAWNVTFHTPTAMRIYLLFFFFPGLCSLMTHLHRTREKKLKSRQWKQKIKSK